MIPSLRAEESLSRMTEVQFGTGSYRKQDRGRVRQAIRRWEREAARGTEQQEQGIVFDPKKHTSLFQNLGLAVVIEGDGESDG